MGFGVSKSPCFPCCVILGNFIHLSVHFFICHLQVINLNMQPHMQVDEIEVCTGPLHILSALVAYHMLLKTKENNVTKHACIQGYLLDFLSTSSWIEKAIAAAVHI